MVQKTIHGEHLAHRKFTGVGAQSFPDAPLRDAPISLPNTAVILPVRRITLGIDVDDTLADVKRPALAEVKRRFGVELPFDQVRNPRTEENIKGVTVTDADMTQILRDIWPNPDQVALLDPTAPAIITTLIQTHKIAITTATDAEKDALVYWLGKQKIPFDEILHVGSSKEKLGFGHVSVFIDDYHPVVEGAAQTGRYGILPKTPWNEHYRKGNTMDNNRVFHSNHWQQVQEFVVTISSSI